MCRILNYIYKIMETISEEKLMIFVLLTLLCKGQPLSVPSVLNKQKSEATSMSYKIPTELSDGTIITINGKLNIDSTLQMVLSSKDDTIFYCSVVFIPRSEIILQSTTKTPYILHHHTGDSITFTLQMDARSLDKDVMEIYFESNSAGLQTLDPCEIDSFNTIDKIILKGVQHVHSLNFAYHELQ